MQFIIQWFQGSAFTFKFAYNFFVAILKPFMFSGDEVPEPVTLPSSRPSRRAKTAALEKTRMNLSKLLNAEADD